MASCSNNSGFDDQFNNPANNYVYPALSPCAGTGNDSNLEFIDDGLGIVSGSEIFKRVKFECVLFNLLLSTNAKSYNFLNRQMRR